AVYALIMVQRAFHGPPGKFAAEHGKMEDLNRRELVTLISLMAILLWLGLYPQPVLDTSQATMRAVENIYQTVQGGGAP
ncbi:MAG TPA: hypothetical protein VM074_08540, partial [Solimonas sp.]|nr:hypothetical protein [Solimonas sp.]